MRHASETKRIDNMLGRLGLPTLGTPGLMQALGFLVEGHEHLRSIINACEPAERPAMYNSLKPHLHFTPKPLDVYVAEMGDIAERKQLPTITPEGGLAAFNPPQISTRDVTFEMLEKVFAEELDECTGVDTRFITEQSQRELATAQRAAEEAVAKQHLHLVCRKCTKEATFGGARKADAISAAREAGWTYGLDPEGNGRELCPDCPGSSIN